MASGSNKKDTSQATRQSGIFESPDAVTREFMVEYLNLQYWSRRSCRAMPLTLGLWLALLALVSYRAHTEASYGIRSAMTDHLTNLTAALTRGAAPTALPAEISDSGESTCTCACAPSGSDICKPDLPTVAGFNGSIPMKQMKYLRLRSRYFQDWASDSTRHLKWAELRTIQDIWFWVQHGFIPEVWHEDPHLKPLDTSSMFSSQAAIGVPSIPPGQLLHWNQIVGGVRMRQLRLKGKACPGDPRLTRPFSPTCHSSEPMQGAFGPGALEDGYYVEGFMPEAAMQGAFDVYLDIKRPVSEVLETVEHMLKAYNWLDSATDALLLQATFMNAEANPPLYGLLEIRFVFGRSGAMRHSIHVRTTMADEYPDMIFIALDAIWISLVVLLMCQSLLQVIFRVQASKKGSREATSLVNFWNVLDWVTIVVSLGIFGGRLFMMLEAMQVDDLMGKLPAEAPPFGAGLDQRKAYHKAWGSILDTIIRLSTWMEYFRLSLFGYIMIMTLQIFKVLRGQPKLAQLASSLFHALEDLIHFGVVFLVLFSAFAFSGYMIYGLELEEWSQPARAINSCFRSLLGDTDLATMYQVAPVSTVMWYWLFLSVMIFLMLNLLLAITYDHYSMIKQQAGQATTIFAQLFVLLRDSWSRATAGGCMGLLCCCCRRDRSIPKHSELLEELMLRCGASDQERRDAHQSILGVKWHRTDRRRHAFAQGEAEKDSIEQLTQASVMKDLKMLGIDPEYASVLIDECTAHGKRECQHEVTQVLQLRRLVNQAEGEISAMRERLVACQGTTKSVMYELTSRLEVLERMVHAGLKELVFIAGAAGVPDAKPAQNTHQRAKLDSTVGALRSLSPAARSETMLSGSVGRVLEHLSHGSPVDVSSNVQDWHRAMRRVDVRGKHIGPPALS